MFGGLGTTELLLLFGLILIIFGPKNLPKIGNALGKGIKQFKDAAAGLTEDEEEDESPRRPSSQIGDRSESQSHSEAQDPANHDVHRSNTSTNA